MKPTDDNCSIVHLPEDAVEELLNNWVLLNEQLPTLHIFAVRQLTIAEVKGRRREHIIRRLHGRYRKLSLPNERKALMRGELWPVRA